MITARVIEYGEAVERTFKNGADLWLYQQTTGCYVESYYGTEEPSDDEADQPAGTEAA